MSRIEDSPDLFGSGVGTSTIGKVTCEYCGTYNAENKTPEGEILNRNGPWVGTTEFAGKTVVDCCWNSIEQEILSRMRDILPWYARILSERREAIEDREENLAAILEALKRDPGKPKMLFRFRKSIINFLVVRKRSKVLRNHVRYGKGRPEGRR
jgi:hypothetical protein